MTIPDLRSPQSWIIAAALIAVVGGSVWGLSRGNSKPQVAIPKELSVESLKAQAEAEPARMMTTVRETMRRDDLTDEQRRQIAENMRKVWEDTMRKRVDDYYAANSEEDKKAILDRQIDEFEERRKELEERRKEDAKNGESRDRADRGQPFRGMFGQQTKEERKERSESRDPDRMARQTAYFSAMRERMSERGIKAPFGPGGGFGGPGGPGGGRGGLGGGPGGGSRPNRGP